MLSSTIGGNGIRLTNTNVYFLISCKTIQVVVFSGNFGLLILCMGLCNKVL